MKTENLATEIAALERKIKSTSNATAKTALQKKITRLKNDLEGEKHSATQLASKLLRAKKTVQAMSVGDFNELIRRLSRKPEYSFLKRMTKTEIKDDIARPAKPVGWRFKGRDNFKTPSAKQVREGKKNGTVYYENRRERSDVSKVAQLKHGGEVTKIKNIKDVKIGDIAHAFGGSQKYTVVGAGTNWSKLKQFDSSGVMSDMKQNPESYGLEPGDFDELEMIAIKNPNGETAVYTYGDDGAWVEEQVSSSKQKSNTNEIKKGDMITISQTPYMASFSALYDKEFDVKEIKEINFASGKQKYYVVNLHGNEFEIPEHFVKKQKESNSKNSNVALIEDYLNGKITS